MHARKNCTYLTLGSDHLIFMGYGGRLEDFLEKKIPDQSLPLKYLGQKKYVKYALYYNYKNKRITSSR